MRKIQILLMSLLLIAGAGTQRAFANPVAESSDSAVVETVTTENSLLDELTGNMEKLIDTRIGEVRKGNDAETIIAVSLLLSVVLPLFIIFMGVVLMNYFNNRAKKQRDLLRHEIYMKALETGQALPEKIFEELGSAKPAEKSSLSSALVMLALGIAFLFIGYVTGNGGLYFASIVGFVGLGRLVAWIIERPKEEKSESNE